MNPYIIPFEKLNSKDIELVGGKNASIGEMISRLAGLGVSVPGGFATTSCAYRDFLEQQGLGSRIREILASLDVDDVERLAAVGKQIRGWMLATPFPVRLREEALEAWRNMGSGEEFAVAVRSSATAEDLPEASFAGQQETFLNVRGEEHLLRCMHEVYASLFNDRAIAYRVHNNFDHHAVALSVGVQHMVRCDLGAAGVMFTLDTDSGFREVVFITSSYGLGETVVQGAVGASGRPTLGAAQEPRTKSHQDGLRLAGHARARAHDRCPARGPPAFLHRRSGRDFPRNPRPDDRAALRNADGHRMGQGRRDRQALYPAGAARDRAEPGRAHHPALHPQV
jgi:pyruvate, water dikinase